MGVCPPVVQILTLFQVKQYYFLYPFSTDPFADLASRKLRQIAKLPNCQIWDFYGYSLNTLKYPKMGIRNFFPVLLARL